MDQHPEAAEAFKLYTMYRKLNILFHRVCRREEKENRIRDNIMGSGNIPRPGSRTQKTGQPVAYSYLPG